MSKLERKEGYPGGFSSEALTRLSLLRAALNELPSLEDADIKALAPAGNNNETEPTTPQTAAAEVIALTTADMRRKLGYDTEVLGGIAA